MRNLFVLPFQVTFSCLIFKGESAVGYVSFSHNSAYWPALYNLPVGAPVVVAVLAGCGHCAPVIFEL